VLLALLLAPNLSGAAMYRPEVVGSVVKYSDLANLSVVTRSPAYGSSSPMTHVFSSTACSEDTGSGDGVGQTSSRGGCLNRAAPSAIPTATAGPTAVKGSAPTLLASGAGLPGQERSAREFGIIECDGTSVVCSGGIVRSGLVADPRDFGGTCGASDSTKAIQDAVNSLTRGGIVIVPCPMTIAGEVSLSGSVALEGIGPIFYPGMSDIPGPSIWPPTAGPAINCSGTVGNGVAMCIQLAGIGNEVRNINFGNPQPPPSSATWTPTNYPPVIGTVDNSGWQGAKIHDVTCTACTWFMDFEGTPDYSTWSANQITVENIWCNPCLNIGVKLRRIDNPFYGQHWDFVPIYYLNEASMGAYLRAHSIGLEIDYAAAPQFNTLNFFANKVSIHVANDTVTNSFGVITMAGSAIQMTNVMSNQSCQAVATDSNNTVVEFKSIQNLYVWGDQSGFHCSKGKNMIDLPSNAVRVNASGVGITYVDTFVNVGCGTPGKGGCPSGALGGGAVGHFDNVEVDNYGAYTAGAVFMKAPVGTDLSLGTTNIALINGYFGAGGLMGAGTDGTQASWSRAVLMQTNNSGEVILNPGTLPTSCSGLATGTIYSPSPHNLGVC
jgi:hypothetical protein